MSSPLYSQIEVELTPPVLDDSSGAFSQNQMDRINAMIQLNLDYVENDIEELLTEMLDKPQLTHALSNTQSLVAALAQQGQLLGQDKYYLGTGPILGLTTPVFNYDELEDYVNELQPEDDPHLGVGAQLYRLETGFPLFRWVEGLNAHLSLGYSIFQKDQLLFENGQFHGSLGYSPFKQIFVRRNLSWKPMHIQFGAGYQYTHMQLRAETGPIVQEFELTPDGLFSNIPSQSVEIEVDPLIYGGVEYSSIALPLSLSSQIQIFQNCYFNMGASLLTSWSQSAITLQGENDIEIVGYISDLITSPAQVVVSGEREGSQGDLFSYYFWSSLQLDMGKVYLNIPVAYSPPQGLGIALTAGIWL